MLEKVRICRCNADDFYKYYELKCTYSDMYWNGFSQLPDKEKLHEVFQERISPEQNNGKKLIRGIFINENDFIGYIQSTFSKNEIEIGISIKDTFQNKGYGSLALSIISDEYKEYEEIVFARIRDDNPRSGRAFEKNGFIPTDDYEEIFYPYVNSKIKLRRYVLEKS